MRHLISHHTVSVLTVTTRIATVSNSPPWFRADGLLIADRYILSAGSEKVNPRCGRTLSVSNSLTVEDTPIESR